MKTNTRDDSSYNYYSIVSHAINQYEPYELARRLRMVYSWPTCLQSLQTQYTEQYVIDTAFMKTDLTCPSWSPRRNNMNPLMTDSWRVTFVVTQTSTATIINTIQQGCWPDISIWVVRHLTQIIYSITCVYQPMIQMHWTFIMVNAKVGVMNKMLIITTTIIMMCIGYSFVWKCFSTVWTAIGIIVCGCKNKVQDGIHIQCRELTYLVM